eukprot:scaffold8.g1517.t1
MGKLKKLIKPMFTHGKAWKILRGDKVMVTAGKDKGQTGTVVRVIRDERQPRVIVEGLNLSKRHIKRSQDNPGGIISVESPIHYSNVALLDPVTNAPVRVVYRYTEEGDKVRVTRGNLASGSVIPRPEVLKQRKKPFPAKPGPLDTPAAEAARATHTPGDLPSFLEHLRPLAGRRPAAAALHTLSAAAAAGSSPAAAAVARLLGGGARQQAFGRGQFWRGFAARGL